MAGITIDELKDLVERAREKGVTEVKVNITVTAVGDPVMDACRVPSREEKAKILDRMSHEDLRLLYDQIQEVELVVWELLKERVAAKVAERESHAVSARTTEQERLRLGVRGR